MESPFDKSCFFIAPIGEPGTAVREDSDQVLRHIVRPAASRFGFNAVRADEIAEPGIITSQVIERIVESPLVIADLTGHNPNVFYELAIRHAIRKPFVQMIRKGEAIPFDVATARTVRYELDLNGAADAVNEIARQIEFLQNDPSTLETPISITLDLQNLRGTEDSNDSGAQHLLPLLEDISGAVHNNSNEIARMRDAGLLAQRPRRPVWSPDIHQVVLEDKNPYGFIASIGSMRPNYPWMYELGVAAYTRVMVGDVATGLSIFDQLIRLIEYRFSSERAFVSEIVPQLGTLFERLVAEYTQASMSDVDDLPF